MMYSDKLVCSVKSNNKILREKHQDGNATIYIPFGSEYSLLLKNLAGQNAVVNIQIDGKEVSKDGIYMKAGSSGEIKGFIDGYIADRAFKFIQKTQEISDFRGDKIDDGMIRVTWQFEKHLPEVKDVYYNYKYDVAKRQYFYCFKCGCWHYDYECPCPGLRLPRSFCTPQYVTITCSNIGSYAGDETQSKSTPRDVTHTAYNSNQSSPLIDDACNFIKSAEVNSDEGITVEGSKVGQSFNYAHARELESNIHSLVLILKGYTDDKKRVNKPILAHDKKQCPSCGRRFKGNKEFCSQDGTALR